MRTAELLLPYPDDDAVVLRVAGALGEAFEDVMPTGTTTEVFHLWLAAQNMATVLIDLLGDEPLPDGDPPSKLLSAVRGPLASNTEPDG